jgi:hypothetical protein
VAHGIPGRSSAIWNLINPFDSHPKMLYRAAAFSRNVGVLGRFFPFQQPQKGE